MTRTVLALAATILLTACANSAGDFANDSDAKWKAMTAASKLVEPDYARCAHGRKPSAIPPAEFVKYIACYNAAEEAKVLPVVNYPPLYQKLMATRTENASLYSQGKIDYEQFKARSKLALIAFVDEATKLNEQFYNAYAAQDQAERDDIAAGLASFKQPSTVRTNCFSTGMSTNCTSRASNY